MRRGGVAETQQLSLEWAVMVWGWGSKRGREAKDIVVKDMLRTKKTLPI